MTLKTGAKTFERMAYKPKDAGPVTLKVAVTGPNAISLKREMTFDVLPPAGDIKRTTVSSIKGNGGKLTVSSDLVHDLIASRTRLSISAGPAARLDVPSLLTQLDRYPYGCAEQTVSRALPLVYANAVAAQLGLGQDKALKARVQGAVDRVFEMQDSSGAFGVWGPSTADLWLTGYVMDFLTRAKEAGYIVKREGFNSGLDRLQNFIAYAEDFTKGGEDRAYALYVLARNARAPIGDLRYYADERLERFSTPLAKAQIGAALSMMGDKERAERVFSAAICGMGGRDPDTGYRMDYGSTLRDGAALVTLASETGIAKGEAPKLAGVIAKAYETRSYTSTQEQAWMLLAANALNDEAKSTKLAINGAPVNGSLLRRLSAAELKNGDVDHRQQRRHGRRCGDFRHRRGVDARACHFQGLQNRARSLCARRQEGRLEEPFGRQSRGEAERPLRHGRESDVGGSGRPGHDRRPSARGLRDREPAPRRKRLGAGLEFRALDGLARAYRVPRRPLCRGVQLLRRQRAQRGRHDVRDQRKRGRREGGETSEAAPEMTPPAATDPAKPAALSATVAYIVRAVRPGTFVHPAATVEDMYRPERYARTAAGTLLVGRKE